MIDIKKVIENPDLIQDVANKKGLKLDVKALLALYEKRNELNAKLDGLRQKRNENTDEIKKSGGKPSEELIKKGSEIKEQVATVEADFRKFDEEYQAMMLYTPQIISADTPVGKDDSENVEAYRWAPVGGMDASPAEFDFQFKDHVELAETLDLIDFERGTKTAGFRGYYLKNEAAEMQMALMMFGMDLMREFGFTPFIVPTIVKEEPLYGSGHFPFDTENIFRVDNALRMESKEDDAKDKKYLVGTAEPSLLNYHRDEILSEDQLPVKFCGFSPCYRSEVGSYGKDTRGIYRVKEFMKIEQIVICKNDIEAAEEMHKMMLGYSEKLLQELGLPYRVLRICTGDMGAGKYKMFDIETWMPSREAYGETHSASNLLDWQTRRLNIRVKGKDGQNYYPYALNNTVVASPRILIPLLENHQNADGTITIPEVLRKYMGGKSVIGKKS